MPHTQDMTLTPSQYTDTWTEDQLPVLALFYSWMWNVTLEVTTPILMSWV